MADPNELLSVLTDNLALLRERERQNREMRAITVSQLTEHLLAQSDGSAGERFAQFCRALPDATGAEKLTLCQGLCRDVSEEHERHTTGTIRISCVSGAGNSAALRALMESGFAAEERHAPSFSVACEDVVDGKCHACLLPLSTSADGRLIRFYDMLERYDLSILLSFEADSEEEPKAVRYALAGRTPLFRQAYRHPIAHELEFALSDSPRMGLEELFSAARACSAELIAMDSIPRPYGTEQNRFYFTLRLPYEHAKAMQCFLALQYPGYEPIGLYPVLSPVSV